MHLVIEAKLASRPYSYIPCELPGVGYTGALRQASVGSVWASADGNFSLFSSFSCNSKHNVRVGNHNIDYIGSSSCFLNSNLI